MITYKSYIQEKQLEPRDSNKEISIIFNKKVIGAGCQSIVYDLNRNNLVLKVFPLNSTSDPSFQFIRLAYNHSENPYFPKIKSYKVYRFKEIPEDERQRLKLEFDYYGIDEHFNFIMVVAMEKLKDGNSDEKLELLSKKFQVDFPISYNFMIDMTYHRHKLIETTTDKHLKNCLRLLEPLFRRKEYAIDVHLGNFLFRGPTEIVFSDPIAPGCSTSL